MRKSESLKVFCTNESRLIRDLIRVFVCFFRYSRKLVVADLYRLPEVVAVREQGGSRLVCLLPSSQIRQSPLGSSQSQEGSSSASGSPVVFEELEYHEPVCRQHYKLNDFRSVLVCVTLHDVFTVTCTFYSSSMTVPVRSCLSSRCSEADFDPDSYNIPFVVMSLSSLASEVHALLHSHEGTLPLLR